MPKQSNGDDVVAQVLQIMVQHVEDLDIRDVARLLQLSSTCRRALQQAVGCLKLVDYRLSYMAATAGFAAWLPHHAGLVQALRLGRPWMGDPEDAAQAAVTAEQVVVFALQITTAAQGVPAAAAGQPQPLGQPASPLRLQSFSSNYIHNPAALRSLAACSSLTQLALIDIPQQRCTAAFCGAIGQLRSLRKLRLNTQDAALAYPSSIAAAVAQLTQLEELHINRLPHAALSQLPASLSEAWLTMQGTGASPTDINISQLSKLLSLGLNVLGRISAQSQLPASLTALHLQDKTDAVSGLGQLQYLHLYRPAACLALLKRLPQLPLLQRVKVRLQHCRRQEQLELVLAALSAGTQLTGLQMYWCDPHQQLDGDFSEEESGTADMRGILLHSYLKKLPRLQLLHLSGIALGQSDLVQFTALTALTDLKFCILSRQA